MFPNIDALANGGMAALLPLLPAVAFFWFITRPLAVGSRALRPFVTCCASFGVMIGAAATWAIHFERANYVDEAVTGALMVGGAAIAIVFLILLLFPRKA